MILVNRHRNPTYETKSSTDGHKNLDVIITGLTNSQGPNAVLGTAISSIATSELMNQF